MMMNAPNESRCSTCNSVLVHQGSICVICDDAGVYEAPLRTSPPLRLPLSASIDAIELGDMRDRSA